MSMGVNVYETLKARHHSILEARASVLEKEASTGKPCVFLSHKTEDKLMVREIGEYIKSKGINIYLDIDDPELQKAVDQNDHRKITEFIERGVRCSTDVMALISDKTKNSWWVPFEIGVGKEAGRNLSCVKLKDSELPSFLEIVTRIRNTKELDDYLDDIEDRTRTPILIKTSKNEAVIDLYDALRTYRKHVVLASGISHPLAKYIDQP